jgi:hypothetical protein
VRSKTRSHNRSSPMPPKTIKRRPAPGQKCCPHCNEWFNVRGFVMHERACRSLQELDAPPPTICVEGGTWPEPGENGTSHVQNLGRWWPNFDFRTQMIARSPRILTQKDWGNLLRWVRALVSQSVDIINESTYLKINRIECTDSQCRWYYNRISSSQQEGCSYPQSRGI